MRQLVYTSLLQIITLREKQIFQLDEWIFFRLVSKYSYIFIFAKTGLREIKNHWFRAKMFQKYILKEILGKFTSTARKYSQLHKLRPPFVRLPFFYSQFGRDQRSQLNNKTFTKRFLAMEILRMFLPYIKSISNHISEVFFFPPQNTRIFLFLLKLVWESHRSRVTDWKQIVSKNIFSIESFNCLKSTSLAKQYFQLHLWSLFFFSPQNFWILPFL